MMSEMAESLLFLLRLLKSTDFTDLSVALYANGDHSKTVKGTFHIFFTLVKI